MNVRRMLHRDTKPKPTLALREPGFGCCWHTLLKHSVTAVQLDVQESLQCLHLQSVAVLRLYQCQLTVFVTTQKKHKHMNTVMILVGNMYKNKRDIINYSLVATTEFVINNNSCHSNHHYYLLVVTISIEVVCAIIFLYTIEG